MVKRFFKRLLAIVIVAIVALGIVGMTINSHFLNSQKKNIAVTVDSSEYTFSKEDTTTLKDFKADCIVVLGCGIKDSETPTPMLKDRLDVGIMLYKMGAAPKILLSADNSTSVHDEIHVMLKYVLAAGIPSEDIFCDHAGVSTYDSMYRLKSIFETEKAIVVTQTYHLYRSLYIANKLGVEAIGVASDQETYSGQPVRELREVLARNKDFFKVLAKKESTVGGSVISIKGDGTVSHGE